MLTVVDIETTFEGRWGGESDNTPYNPNNKLVSVGYKTSTGESGYLIFNHKHAPNTPKNFSILQDVLARSKLVIGHNLKFDMTWLLEAGFKYEGKLYDTMIFEYVKACGLKTSLKLKDILEGYGLSPKLDILEEYCGVQGLGVDEVPLDELIKYGQGDVDSTYELFSLQCDLLKTDPVLQSMKPALKLMNEFLEVLIDVERQGIKIDLVALNDVELEFKQQQSKLEERLKQIVASVMGHTPINLQSPEHISWILHSVKVKDKKVWKEIFNLGSEERNGVRKQKYTRKYNPKEFRMLLKEHTTTLKKTTASQCSVCHGTGRIQKYSKDGKPYKNKNLCHTCNTTGILYTPTQEIAGFRIPPISSLYAADGGFSSGKDTLEELLHTNISDEAKEFIELYRQYNAINSYLSTFVEGIRKNVRDNAVLHTSFNQCVTATGRLSSTRPNLQNQPRESTFPIRKVFISRFAGGKILDVDWSGLEFRTAVALSGDLQGKYDIENKVDVHRFTADTLTKYGQITDRQSAKRHTFKPLFAGSSGTAAEIKYYEEFNKKYHAIHAWQESLVDLVLKQGYMQSPSTRCYKFPFVKRTSQGRVNNQTQIYNYMIQGFATGDLMPCTLIDIYQALKPYKSYLCLTVHDSALIDVHPDEIAIVPRVVFKCFNGIKDHLKRRFDFTSIVDFEYEAKMGDDWLTAKKIDII